MRRLLSFVNCSIAIRAAIYILLKDTATRTNGCIPKRGEMTCHAKLSIKHVPLERGRYMSREGGHVGLGADCRDEQAVMFEP